MSGEKQNPSDLGGVPGALVAEDFASFTQALGDRSGSCWTTRDVTALSRHLQSLPGEPDFSVFYAGNFTLDFLPRFVDVSLARVGIRSTGRVAPFDQYVQEVLDPASALRSAHHDLVFLALDASTLRPELSSLPGASADQLRDDMVAHVVGWAEECAAVTSANVLVCNFPRPDRPILGVADSAAENGEAEFYLEVNLCLLRALRGHPRVHLFDLERLYLRDGRANISDPKLFHLAKVAWRDDFLITIGDEVARFGSAMLGRTKKCLVLDLDNTLWGGVVGEDGPEGVQVGAGTPHGEAFMAFQQRIRALKARGVLLAVVSKNNREDVEELFRVRGDMPLNLDDFVATEINWDPKPVNLERIARTLNIGVDSLVFVDDNPAECAFVRGALPEVLTVHLPRDPSRYVAILDELDAFERTSISDEDKLKTSRYREEVERKTHGEQFENLEQYLHSLDIEVMFSPVTEATLKRVHDLFMKTNQFNATTIRYSVAELESFVADPTVEVGTATARDRFGDLGLIAVYVLRTQTGVAMIDSFVMSCRAMGRGIETAFTNSIKGRHLLTGSVNCLAATYVPTRKNRPIEAFFDRQGFRLVSTSAEGHKRYELQRGEAALIPCDWVRTSEMPYHPETHTT